MVFNATFNNISVTQMYVVAVSFIGGENHWPRCLSQVTDKLYHIMLTITTMTTLPVNVIPNPLFINAMHINNAKTRIRFYPDTSVYVIVYVSLFQTYRATF